MIPQLLLFSFATSLFASTTNTPVGKAGVPGEGSCADCHNSQVNTRSGRVTLEFPSLPNYSQELTHEITVRITPSRSGLVAGYQVTARLVSNPLEQAGQFQAYWYSNSVVRSDGQGHQYVTHSRTLPASATPTFFTQAFSFAWTAPKASVGDVRFYVSAVAGDGTLIANDDVYTATYTISPILRSLPTGYRWQFIDAPGGSTVPSGISTNGRVVGASGTKAFVRGTDGAVTTFEVPSAVSTAGNAINAQGQVVGSYLDAAGKTHGFLRSPGGEITTIDYPASLSTELVGISDSGRMAGVFIASAAASRRGFLFTAASGFSEVTIPGEGPARILGMNASGGFLAYPVNSPFHTIYGLGEYTSGFQGPCFGILGFAGLNDYGETVWTCISSFIDPLFGSAYQSIYRSAYGLQMKFGGENPLQPGSSDVRFAALNNSGTVVGRTATRGLLLEPCDATATLSTSFFTFSGDGGSGSFPMTATAGCQWFSGVSEPWILPELGSGTGTYRFRVDANPLLYGRSGTLWAGGATISVNQAGMECNYGLSSPNVSFTALGGDGILSVAARPGCSWSLGVQESWLTVTTRSGLGSRLTSFRVSQNVSPSSRSATISMFGAVSLTIRQDGATTCLYDLALKEMEAPGAGGTLNVSVLTSLPGCTGWTTTSNTSWITVLVPTPGVSQANLAVAANTSSVPRVGTVTIAGQTLTVLQRAGDEPAVGLYFVPMPPCRLVDTRLSGGRLIEGTTRQIAIAGSPCAIPPAARAYSLNVTAVPSGRLGALTVWAAGASQPQAATLYSDDGRVVASAAIVPAGTNGALSVSAPNDTDFVLDVNGYFQPPTEPGGMGFFKVPPCRIADSRPGSGKTGAFGGPILPTFGSRDIPVPSSPCGIPPSATAYALNVTALPSGPLAYLTVYPAGQARPLVSTLNSFTGWVVANAAIVPAGVNGAISLFASDATHYVVDINGYFAPRSAAAGAAYFPVKACRVADTRAVPGTDLPANATRIFPIAAGSCMPAGIAAGAFVLNASVFPLAGPLAFLTLFSSDSTLPLASTLNAFNGQVVSNMAIVPGGSSNTVSAYVSHTTNLVLDLHGYFAP